ncbi:MAG: alginate export family protein [Bdellovibrionaceae bacterium]|nr:alginate export family protein [Pseudobdellovibrionaceae bacterium]
MLNRYIASLIFLLLSNISYAYDFKLSPVGRVRYESLSDYDLNATAGDFKSFTGSRFWILAEMTHQDYKIVFQPQFSRTWGLDEVAGPSSGTTIDPTLNVHQAYFTTPISERFQLKLGRQELSYGDELVLGSVIWSNVGRSFDAIKLEWKMGHSQLHFFSSKLSDRNATVPSSGDKDLHGLYFSGRNEMTLFNEVDVYLLDINDSTVSPHIDTLSYGFRLKGYYSFWDYRGEFTKQHLMSRESSQFDVETGVQFDPWGRLAVNYFVATEGYNQLFPTAHKWLGIGDVVSRKNVKGFQIKHQLKINEKIKTEITYHKFERYDNGATAFAFSGAALGGSTSLNNDIGEEYDLIANFSQNENLSYQLGAAYFIPGQYLKDSAKADDYTFIYLQLMLKM